MQPHGLYSTRLLCPLNSPGKNTGVGGHSLLQGIFPTQGLNPCLLHCRQTLYHLSRQGGTGFYKVLFNLNFFQKDNIHTLKAGGGTIKTECLRNKSSSVVSCFVTNTINLEALKQLAFIIIQFPWIRRPAWLNWIVFSGSLTKVLASVGLLFLWKSSFR